MAGNDDTDKDTDGAGERADDPQTDLAGAFAAFGVEDEETPPSSEPEESGASAGEASLDHERAPEVAEVQADAADGAGTAGGERVDATSDVDREPTESPSHESASKDASADADGDGEKSADSDESADDGGSKAANAGFDAATLDALRDQIGDAARSLKKLGRTLRSFDTKRSSDDPVALRELAAAIVEGIEPLGPVEEHARALRATAQELADELERGAVSRIRRELAEIAAAEEIEARRVSDHPPVIALGQFLIELDASAHEAHISVARERLDTVPLSTSAIVDTWRSERAALRERIEPSERFFSVLHAAYRTVLLARNEEPGARCDLVDLLPALSLHSVDTDRWRRDFRRTFDGYPRHLLALQIARLRRDRLLEHSGVRLDLGSATGGSTRDKRNVVFVPSGVDAGQYYLTIRFVAAR